MVKNMYDPELKYCPKCKDEYRADIENCAACGIELLTGEAMADYVNNSLKKRQSRKGDLTPDDDIVTIHKGTLADMRCLEQDLQEEHIGYLIAGDEPGGCGQGCCASNFYLQVRREDAGDAFTIIEKQFSRTTGLNDFDLSNVDSVFNPDAGMAVCPACGFTFQTSTTTCPECGLCFG